MCANTMRAPGMERASEEGNFHHCYSQVVHDTFPWALTMFSGRLCGEGIEPPPHPKQSWPVIHSFANYLLNACCVPGTQFCTGNIGTQQGLFLKCVLSSSYVPNISQMLGIQGGVKRKLCEKKVFSHETYCLVKEIITQNSLYNPNRCY